jgi:putative nucleotidyltransferase with HDIG domain
VINLTEIIEQAIELAPLPASTVRLAGMATDPNCHLGDLADLIAFDQVLTLKLLRAANSAASASALRVGDVREAISRMGVSQVVTLAVAAGARPSLQKGIPSYGLAEGALWRHSVAAAVAVEAMQEFVRIEIPPEAFAAALLHDVGKLVLSRMMSPEIVGFIRHARDTGGLTQPEAESLFLNINHGELGGYIAMHWKMPPRIVAGIAHHHSPEKGNDPICDMCYLANLAAKQIEAGLDGKAAPLGADPDVTNRLGLSAKALEEFSPKASWRYAQVSRRYNAV